MCGILLFIEKRNYQRSDDGKVAGGGEMSANKHAEKAEEVHEAHKAEAGKAEQLQADEPQTETITTFTKQQIADIVDYSNSLYSNPNTTITTTSTNTNDNTAYALILSHVPAPMAPLVPEILARGPDYGKITCLYQNLQTIWFLSSVLGLRAPFTEQPLECERYVLQFNGEIYDDAVEGNDTCFFMERVKKHGVVDTVTRLDGEYAYCLYDKHTRTLEFGRDFCGKRSLMYQNNNNGFLVSSVGGSGHWTECKGNTVYTLNTNTLELRETALNDAMFHVTAETALPDPKSTLDTLNTVLLDSVKQRVLCQNFSQATTRSDELSHVIDNHVTEPERAIRQESQATGARVAVLFSGGVDCTLIAAYCAKVLCPGSFIDLINVSFANARTGGACAETPDRIQGLRSAHVLQKAHNHVTFNFVAVDVAYAEYLEAKSRVVSLMSPKSTAMDLSIAIAFHFGARAVGTCRGQPVVSSSRVLLSGLGADELFGGYSRFSGETEPEEMRTVLEKEIARIWERNLGRDDRVTSCWGREMRYPFLSRHVISHVCNSVPLAAKIQGNVRKWGLRQLAKNIKGAEGSFDAPKRAIQFGAKSAKMDPGSGRARGGDAL